MSQRIRGTFSNTSFQPLLQTQLANKYLITASGVPGITPYQEGPQSNAKGDGFWTLTKLNPFMLYMYGVLLMQKTVSVTITQDTKETFEIFTRKNECILRNSI